jgi:hypothetical protein
MLRLRPRIVLIGVLALAALVFGCQGGLPAGSSAPDATGRTPSCGTVVTLKVAIHGNGPAIEEDATSQCVHTPTLYNVVLTLFRNTDGGPVQISDSVGRLNNGCDNIPVAGTTIDCIWWVSPCLYNASYQGLATINGEGPNGPGPNAAMEFFRDEEKSPLTPLRCR